MHLFRFATPLLLVPGAFSQQFVERIGTMSGPVLWSEAIVPLDVNLDGNLDVFVVNAQGYAEPGDFGAPSSDPLRPTMLIQTGLNGGIPVFEDRTDLLIPAAIEIHGKSVAVCDVDGDGLEDLVLAVAFGDQQRLLRKDPNGPGYLDETFRLPSLVINSFHVGWGDLDDDGDIDLVFTDAGPNSFDAPGGKARLLLNDGHGFFTLFPGKLGAIHKIGSQNAKIVDLDGDLDLDIVVDGKSPVTQVYINDGNANFTLDTSLVPPAAPANGLGAYETEWGDLDGDLDLDCMYMNFAGSGGFPSTDVAMRNELTETGSLSLDLEIDAMNGENSQDENDFVFLDADDDGDLDVLVAALTFGSPPTPDKLFRNSGSFGPGFLDQVVGAITPNLDATLDMAVADFNQDGRYDIVTANGEIPNSSFENRYFENVGPVDTTSPTIGRVTPLTQTISMTRLVARPPLRTWIQDAIVDDEYSCVDASLEWSASKHGASSSGTIPLPHVGGYIYRGVIFPTPTSEGIVGATVSVTVRAEDCQGNTSQSQAQSFIVCGSQAYGQGTGLSLALSNEPSLGGAYEFQVSGGDANQSGAIVLGVQPDSVPFGGGTLLVAAQGASRTSFTLDGSGNAHVSISVAAASVVGDTAFAQAIARSGTGLALSNGLEAVLCE